MPPPILDHVDQMLDDLLSQFGDSLRLRALLELVGDEVQQLENVLNELHDERLLATAEGAQLDQYGKLAGVTRGGLVDDDYRVVVQVWLAALRSHGLARVITWCAAQLVGEAVQYRQRGRAHYSLEYETASPISAARVRLFGRVLDVATPAGVSYEVTEGDEGTAFRFDTAGRGFDEGTFARGVL